MKTGPSAEKSNGADVQTTTPAPISASDLPAASSSSISLLPATRLEQYQCAYINSHSWKGPLSVAQYLAREAFLERQLLTRDGKITYWILTDTSMPVGQDGARPILASCETLQKVGYVANDGSIKQVLTHGIASVFCRHEYRGRGYASRMMNELATTLETWQQSKGSRASFSMLWSDIGRSFYAAHGWRPMSSTHISLPAITQQTFFQSQTSLDCSRIQDLYAQDLRNRICPKAVAILEAELRARSRQRPSISHVAIRPDYEQMEWHFAREEFHARALHHKEPHIKGADDPSTGCVLIWSRVWGETAQKNKLHILYTMTPTEPSDDVIRSIAALLIRGQLEAKKWDMQAGVELWSPTAEVVKAAQLLAGEEDVQIAIRDKESICSLRWVNGGDEDMEWVANEKYAWC
jgi:GNAT superfamily N-acetyltransferase